jgi:integrase/recombinase XerC
MNPLADKYLQYVSTVRRYSPRTQETYKRVLESFCGYSLEDAEDPDGLVASLTPTALRNYEVHLLEDQKMGARSVNLHLSVLSGFCRYLMTQGLIKSNPVRLVTRPKTEKRLPEFYRDDAMENYFKETAHAASEDELELLKTLKPTDGLARTLYERRLRRLVICVLHGTGIRRAELASLDVRDLDKSRNVLKVKGKGDKMREVPLVPSVVRETELYLEAAEAFFGGTAAAGDPLLRTPSGRRLYPSYIDRAVKTELGGVADITGRKSPHVLRHTLATELLNEGSDINAIKELLGHSSLAATQVYTHNSIEKLKAVYETAHPRAKDPERK